MLCALTVRRLKRGAFERFREAFMAHEYLDDPPSGYVHFNMVRNAKTPDEVIEDHAFGEAAPGGYR